VGRRNYSAINHSEGRDRRHAVENDVTCVIGKMPVAESFGFSNDIRAATQGRAVWNTENAGYDEVPPELFHKIVGEIRQRKGLKEEIPGEAQYTD